MSNNIIPFKNDSVMVRLWHIGWLVTFFLIPFGSSLPGLLLLLIPSIFFCISTRKLKENRWIILTSDLSGWANRLFLIFLFLALISSLFSSQPFIAILILFGFSILLYVFYFGAQQLANEFDTFVTKKCVFILIINSFLSCIISLIRYLIDINSTNPYGRAINLFSGCNGFATIIIIVCGLSLGFLFQYKSHMKYFTILFLIINTITILLTKSRGGWLGFLTMLGIFAILNRKSLIIMLIIFIGIGLAFCTIPSLKDRLFSLFYLEKNMARFNIWQATLQIIRDHPIIGIGTGLFSSIYPKYVTPNFVITQASFAHNIFLEIAAEFGLLGLLIFSTMIIVIIRMSFLLTKTGNKLYQGIFAALVGVLIHQQFDLPIWGFDIGGAFWMLLGLIVGLYRIEKNKNNFLMVRG